MNALDNNTEEILSGNLRRLMWKLSLPSIIAMVLWGMNNLADAIFVGRMVGAEALAGLALAIPYTAIALGIGQWIGTGGANVLSHAIGANATGTRGKIVPMVTVLSILGSLVVGFPLYYFAEDLLKFMGGQGHVLRYGVQYFEITSLGCFFWIYGMALNLLIRGEGKMKRAAVMVVIGLIVNISMTPFLIHVAHMGTAGAAWAINTGMFCLCAIQLLYLYKGKTGIFARCSPLVWDAATARQIMQSGLPGFIYTIMSLIQATIILRILTAEGDPRQVAVYAAINTVSLFVTTPLYGLMQAFQPVAGINFGAKKIGRIMEGYKIFIINGLMLLLPFWAVMMIFPSQVLSLILTGNITALEVLYFRLFLSTLPLLPFLLVSISLLPAVKKSGFASCILLVRQLVLFIPVMVILPRLFGILAIYMGTAIINVLVALLTVFFVVITFRNLKGLKNG